MTAFFVPGAEPEQVEARYGQLAQVAGAEAAPPADRIRSLRFVRDAEEWTATVGDPLTGRLGARADRRPARRSAAVRRVVDPATVQAIFDTGGEYLVLTDSPPVGPVDDSTWENPFPVPRHETRAVVRFDG